MATLSGFSQAGEGLTGRLEVWRQPSGTLVPVAGQDGASIDLRGTVATWADLPTLEFAERGAMFIVNADGLGYVWDGTAWPASGDGVHVRGPKGDTGRSVTSIRVEGDGFRVSMSDGSSSLVSVPALVEAVTAAQDAAGSATAAAGSATESGEARDEAVAAAGTATTKADVATTQAGLAGDHASAAGVSEANAGVSETNAGTSESNAAAHEQGAIDARDDTFVARDAAVAAQGGAEAAESAASGSAATADSHAGRAEAAANAFDLTATSTTGVSGSDASVTVTGDGPAYGLEFTLPRGDKGAKGDPGEVSQAELDAAVASLVDGSPDALDTLSELAAALGNDPNFATTISTEIGLRAKTADVNAALADKSDVGHSHAWSEVTSKPTEFPPASHGHAISDVTGLQADLADAGDTAVWSQVSGKPSMFPPASHSHSWGEITSKPTAFPPATHTHTADEVGLGNVDNTSDASKPVSTAQQAAIDARPAMWLWDGSGTWSPPAAANDGDSVLNLSTSEIHSITEV